MQKWLLPVLMGMILISFPCGFAQAELEYEYGKVIAVDASSGKMTISQYDCEADEDVPVEYSISSGVELENASAVEDILPGSYIDFEYDVTVDGKKVVESITVYEMESGEDHESETLEE